MNCSNVPGAAVRCVAYLQRVNICRKERSPNNAANAYRDSKDNTSMRKEVLLVQIRMPHLPGPHSLIEFSHYVVCHL